MASKAWNTARRIVCHHGQPSQLRHLCSVAVQPAGLQSEVSEIPYTGRQHERLLPSAVLWLQVPQVVPLFTGLLRLSLNGNNLVELPEELEYLKGLRVLELAGNRFDKWPR
jgi:hypothetical protein